MLWYINKYTSSSLLNVSTLIYLFIPSPLHLPLLQFTSLGRPLNTSSRTFFHLFSCHNCVSWMWFPVDLSPSVSGNLSSPGHPPFDPCQCFTLLEHSIPLPTSALDLPLRHTSSNAALCLPCHIVISSGSVSGNLSSPSYHLSPIGHPDSPISPPTSSSTLAMSDMAPLPDNFCLKELLPRWPYICYLLPYA